MTRWLLPLVLAAALVSPTSASAAAPYAARHLLWHVNHARVQAGLPLIPGSSALASVAQWRAQDMCDRDYRSHDIPGGRRFNDELDRRGVQYRLGYEIIAWVGDIPDRTDQAMRWWRESPSHWVAIVGRFTRAGAGYVRCDDGYAYMVVLFTR